MVSLLVLDLDKTLVYVDVPEDFGFYEEVSPYTVRRPGLEEFMRNMAQVYEIVVFSAAPSDYVHEIITKQVDPSGSLVKAALSSEDMEWVQLPGSQDKVKVKDLRKLNRDLNKVVWLDDTPSLYVYHPCNGIAIKPFKGDLADDELRRVTPLLLQLADSDNVPESLKTLSNHLQTSSSK